jgi:hypothetical protein
MRSRALIPAAAAAAVVAVVFTVTNLCPPAMADRGHTAYPTPTATTTATTAVPPNLPVTGGVLDLTMLMVLFGIGATMVLVGLVAILIARRPRHQKAFSIDSAWNCDHD